MATRELSHPTHAGQIDWRLVRRSAGSSFGLSPESQANSKQIRILIIEDHRVVAEALEAWFNEQPGLVVVGKLGSVAEAQSCIVQESPDVLIVDFHLADGTGTEAVKALRQNGCQAQVIILTHDDGDLARLAAVEAGASAFLHKTEVPKSLIDAIRRVADGASLIDASTIASLLRKSQEMDAVRGALTTREREVLRMAGDGLANRDIATRLGISYTTVRTHIRSIAGKLGAHSKLEAVVKARQLALVD